jgi:type IV secretion system protein TrbG
MKTHPFILTTLIAVFCISASAQTPGASKAQAEQPLPSLVDYMCGTDSARRQGAANSIVAKPSPYSSKLVVFPYHKDAIYPVNTFFNRFTHFEFETGERLVGVFVSDETEFERHVAVTGRDAMIRPRTRGASGSATIITDRRRYQIELRDVSVCPQENQYQRVSWLVDQGIYEDASAIAAAPNTMVAKSAQQIEKAVEPTASTGLGIKLDKLNTDYTIEGSDEIKPVMVMDDGERTYLKFPDSMTLRPAMFAVSKAGEPQIVEYAAQNAYFISAQIFTHGILLKHDKSEVRILSKKSKCGFWNTSCKTVNTSQFLSEAR